MTNKINGIDVSECGFCCWKHNVNELIENYCAVFNNKCICNPDCYFKQLKRLQQQTEAYQLSENEAKEIIAELEHKNKRLQEENEELKKYQYTQEYLQSEIEKRQKALEEIREDLETQVYCECLECGNDDYSACIECMTKRYKEIINEVLK